MKEPILVVLAAGIGSRFGGLKQMTPFGAHGESLIDYSLFDALRAGFQRVVFIVNGKIKDDFREIVGKNVENRMEVHYALQEIDKLPQGFTVPEGRSKPWGTAHAVLCAKDVIDAPFCALNGDDFYGRQALQHMYTFLSANQQSGTYTMVGYSLANTLSEYGYVSRGRCLVDENNYLQDVEELTHIISTTDGPLYTKDGQTYYKLPSDTTVSMNIWGFTTDFITHAEAGFADFLMQAQQTNPLKAEYYLPGVVSDILNAGKATVKVASTTDSWFGVTNQADRPRVEAALRELTASGQYPDGLWK